MRKFLLITAIVAGATALLIAKPKTPAMGNKTVVVELFTSQG